MASPAPWRVVAIDLHETGLSNDGVAVVDAAGEAVANNQTYYPCALDPANAHLISAAPELLAALKALTVDTVWRQLCFRTHNGIPMGMSKKQERLAKKAIAKAEGK